MPKRKELEQQIIDAVLKNDLAKVLSLVETKVSGVFSSSPISLASIVRESDGAPLLHMACLAKAWDVAEYLICIVKVDVNVRWSGQSPLDLACTEQNEKTAQFLLSHGAERKCGIPRLNEWLQRLPLVSIADAGSSSSDGKRDTRRIRRIRSTPMLGYARRAASSGSSRRVVAAASSSSSSGGASSSSSHTGGDAEAVRIEYMERLETKARTRVDDALRRQEGRSLFEIEDAEKCYYEARDACIRAEAEVSPHVKALRAEMDCSLAEERLEKESVTPKFEALEVYIETQKERIAQALREKKMDEALELRVEMNDSVRSQIEGLAEARLGVCKKMMATSPDPSYFGQIIAITNKLIKDMSTLFSSCSRNQKRLIAAVENGDVANIEKLFAADKKLSPNFKNADGVSLIALAKDRGVREILIAHGAKCETPSIRTWIPPHLTGNATFFDIVRSAGGAIANPSPCSIM